MYPGRLPRLASGLLVLLALVGQGCAPSAPTATKPAAQPAAPAPAAPAGEKVVLKFAHNQVTSTPQHQAAEMFKQLVEERTKGYYDVQIFPAQQLGTLRDQVEGTMVGTIELTQQPASTYALFVPRMSVLDLPFLMTTEEAMWKVLDGPVGQELLQSLEAKGMKGADIWSAGWKNITTGRKAVQTPDDLKGLKIRIIPSPLLTAQYEAWGASPTPVDFKELYTALQQGVVDGQENPAGSIVDVKLYEVQKYMTESHHAFFHYIMAFNKDWFDAQPRENREILVQALQETGRWERQVQADREAEATRRIREADVQVVELTPQAREQFRQLSLQVHDKFADQIGKDFLQRLSAEIERASR